jgi:hypothetical protein
MNLEISTLSNSVLTILWTLHQKMGFIIICTDTIWICPAFHRYMCISTNLNIKWTAANSQLNYRFSELNVTD